MAKIILDPGEQFEHSHDQTSQTILEEGNVDLKMLGDKITLNIGQVVDVPAHTSHTLVNQGDVRAQVQCVH